MEMKNIKNKAREKAIEDLMEMLENEIANKLKGGKKPMAVQVSVSSIEPASKKYLSDLRSKLKE